MIVQRPGTPRGGLGLVSAPVTAHGPPVAAWRAEAAGPRTLPGAAQ